MTDERYQLVIETVNKIYKTMGDCNLTMIQLEAKASRVLRPVSAKYKYNSIQHKKKVQSRRKMQKAVAKLQDEKEETREAFAGLIDKVKYVNEKMDKLNSSGSSSKRASLANSLKKLDLSKLDKEANAKSANSGFFNKELEASDGLVKNKE